LNIFVFFDKWQQYIYNNERALNKVVEQGKTTSEGIKVTKIPDRLTLMEQNNDCLVWLNN
jgi:hypothetical protein